MKSGKTATKTGLIVLTMGVISLLLGSCGLVDQVRSRIGGAADTGMESPSGGTAATITYLEGTVTVNGIASAIGDIVMDGDQIVTGNDSLAELEFGNYRILRAESDSRFSLDSAAGLMKLDGGGLSVVQSKARRLSKDKAWRLQTPTTVAAVRGTVYYAHVEDSDHTYFCLCNGRITLSDADKGAELRLDAHHHDAVRFIRTDSGVVYSDAPMEYHSDADMESLADAVHVPIDWTSIPD